MSESKIAVGRTSDIVPKNKPGFKLRPGRATLDTGEVVDVYSPLGEIDAGKAVILAWAPVDNEYQWVVISAEC